MYSSRVYRNSPSALQSVLVSGRSWLRRRMREGRRFDALLDEAMRTQWLSAAELADYQHRMLDNLLQHARSSVPFYRDRPLRMDGADTSAPGPLAGWPLMTKQDVRSAGDALHSSPRRWPLFRGTTSGTTGTPLAMVQDLYAITRENAFLARQLRWAGWQPGERRAWLRGDTVVPVAETRPPFWRTNIAEHMLMLSSYHLAESTCASYIDALTTFAPTVIQAYPSSIAFIASWLECKGVDYPGPPLKGIVTSSEAMSPEQAACIERRFGCRVFDWYGQFERVAAIGTCEHGSRHLITDYSYVEILPGEAEQLEIVGTGFNNFSMPLIRYRTGDFVTMPSHADCPCGRAFPVVQSIVGRQDDSLVLPGNRMVGRGLGHIVKDVPGIIESQIRQTRDGDIRILVVCGRELASAENAMLLGRARERLGEDIPIRVERVDEIPRGRNGKYTLIVRE